MGFRYTGEYIMELYDLSKDGNDPFIFSEEEHKDIVFFVTNLTYLQLLFI
jgi:hypothetical protein